MRDKMACLSRQAVEESILMNEVSELSFRGRDDF